MLINTEQTTACPIDERRRVGYDDQRESNGSELKKKTSYAKMSRRSLSLPGRPSRLTLIEKKMPLPERKKVHWSTDLEEVIYFSPDSMIRRQRDVSGMRSFDRRVRMLRSRSVSLNKRLPLKATQTFTRSLNDVNSMLIRTGVNILSHQLERLRSRSESLEMFDQQSNNRWNELLALYQKQMRDQLAEQEEEWV